MNKSRFAPGQEGFTLVELLIAVTIFAIGLLAVAGMQITSIRGNSTANIVTSGTAVAEGILEEVLSWDGSRPVFAADAADLAWNFGTVGSPQATLAVEGGGTFSATYTIDADYDGVVNVSRVQVTVTQVGGVLNRPITLVGFKRRV
ncbi:prepilin-type N-terminal cleavage/methylation domain-containing protein [Desulfuromonas sp. KJ2020]|uniref:prepilin-type N-terminal cleavage/methylation domain-containing protein n=1 Tax=Desulfuromonas sp. KJ2020 TaxID=2919173 RepID=UPI000324D6A0|nr:prepilin-type N-terminal cleavage/methylation domain-containing protein [Desulfuromonas sp. KJ2020]MCP3177385.1 prepilin-type N-terminal cleavage/methylation domain-containing protein [Desulfuromonas sp. KJ2020]